MSVHGSADSGLLLSMAGADRGGRRPARIAIVTGASRGIGAGVVEMLKAGGSVVVGISKNDAAEGTDKLLRCDVTDPDQVESAVHEVEQTYGRVDILVNSAGGTGPIETPCQDYPLEDFRDVLELNVLGTFLPCKAAIPHLIRQGGGRIVNIAGTSGIRGYKHRVGYSSSKWAVRGLTKTLALELGPHGVTVNAVVPNVTNGDRMERIVREKARKTGSTPEAVYADFAGQTALGRFIDEVDVAAAVSFLVSDGARNITGQDIVVDAGWSV
jgi:NAD(P)-dependent dehydrogenase (short-subunit alcohol dehydrogenase family)